MKSDKFNPLDPDDAVYLDLFWRMIAELYEDPIARYARTTKVWDRWLM